MFMEIIVKLVYQQECKKKKKDRCGRKRKLRAILNYSSI